MLRTPSLKTTLSSTVSPRADFTFIFNQSYRSVLEKFSSQIYLREWTWDLSPASFSWAFWSRVCLFILVRAELVRKTRVNDAKVNRDSQAWSSRFSHHQVTSSNSVVINARRAPRARRGVKRRILKTNFQVKRTGTRWHPALLLPSSYVANQSAESWKHCGDSQVGVVAGGTNVRCHAPHSSPTEIDPLVSFVADPLDTLVGVCPVVLHIVTPRCGDSLRCTGGVEVSDADTCRMDTRLAPVLTVSA